ncbi:MAG: hypothetical protein O2856_15490 [Planctomycetota bacterium]|nr:hypothetical protein [Planctomycetota bacterium]
MSFDRSAIETLDECLASLAGNAGQPSGVQSRMVVKVSPFCPQGLSLQGEPPWGAHPLHVAAWPSVQPPTRRWSRRGREVLLGKQDLLKSGTPAV